MNFYDSIIEGAQELAPIERGQLYAAVLEFLMYQREPDFPMRPAPKAMFIMMRPVLENQVSAKERGRKGGRPRKGESRPKAEVSESDAKRESKTKHEVTETPTIPESEQEQEQEVEEGSANALQKKSAPRFVPPTPEEVDAYIAEKGYSGFDGEQFCAFYASKGWKVGRAPMRSWRHAVVTWWKDRQPGGSRFDQAARADRGRERFDRIDWGAYEVADEGATA